MLLDRLYMRDIELVKRVKAAPDSHGVARYTDDVVTPAKGWLNQSWALEEREGSQRTTLGGMVFLPPEVDVAGTDALRIDGDTFEISRAPELMFSPRGPHHWEIEVRRTEG